MVKVKVKRGKDNNLVSVEVSGHALSAPCGSDIVCAAVSVLTQTVIFALDDLLGIRPPLKMEEGYLFLSVPFEIENDKKEKLYLLLETMLLGLKETAMSYPRYLDYAEE
ncbi:MAG: ribosomal-processing cysteine protease Prp [Bacillota bacterium]|nr:ribosomal-processing cysteine protease Prp [Bacillota bacterium]